MSVPLRVLIVEDRPADAELMVHELRRAGFDPQWQRVETEADYLARLNPALDVILSDHSMPQFGALEALRLLRERELDVPFFIVSGSIGEDVAVAAMREGATDYLLKDRLARLGQSVKNALDQKGLRDARRRAEEQIKLQTRALEAAANGIIITDSKGIMLWVNPALSAMTGYAVKELIGRHTRILKSGKHDKAFYRKLWDTILAGEVWHSEITNRRKDGTFYEEEMTITAVRAASGEITHFVAIKQDITEKKQAADALRTTQERLTHLLAHSPAVIYSLRLDRQAVILSVVSENIAVLLGFAAEETLRPEWWQEHVHPEDLQRALAAMTEVLARGTSSVEYRIRRKEGTYCWIEDHKRLVRDAAGAPTEVAGVWNDVTERKQAEEAIKESEKRFRQLAENIHDVFWMTSADLKDVSYVSPAYETVWGQAAFKLYGYAGDWIEAIVPEDRPRVMEAFAQLAHGAPEVSVEYRIRRPDGSVRQVLDRRFPVYDEGGKLYRIAGVAKDVTQSRELEEQLRQSQKMEGIGQLAGGVAHDFNNLLTVIQLNTEMLLLKEAVAPEALDLVKEIVRAADQAAGLTRQLLTFSRKQVMQVHRLDVNRVIGDLSKMLRRIIGEDVRLQCNPASQLPLVDADAGMLEQALMNLAVNARDAMPKGGQLFIDTEVKQVDESYVHAHPEARAGGFVCLSVRDTGTGIAPDVLPRIFEPFFTTKEAGKGTGLGLATVYGIAKQHQGWIEVASEVGAGTTFKLFLPALPASAKAKSDKPVETKVSGGNETILLVEDEGTLRSLTRRILENYGYQILEAPTGVVALEVWQQHAGKVDLLLTDMVMPDGLMGRELAELLRSQKPRLKVIFSSGYTPDIAGRGLTEQDRKHLLQKPFPPRMLAQVVRDCLDGK